MTNDDLNALAAVVAKMTAAHWYASTFPDACPEITAGLHRICTEVSTVDDANGIVDLRNAADELIATARERAAPLFCGECGAEQDEAAVRNAKQMQSEIDRLRKHVVSLKEWQDDAEAVHDDVCAERDAVRAARDAERSKS